MRPSRPRPLLAFALPLLLPAASAAFAKSAKPAWIDGFSGWAGPGGGWIYARAHHGKPQPKPKPGQSSYLRLKQSIETLELEALKDGTVAVSGIPGMTH